MKYLLVVQLYGNLSITTATSEINENVESMSRFLTTHRNIELLEPYEGKLSRTVLRGEGGSNALDLPDEVREKVDTNASFISFLCTIAKNLLMNMYQRQTVEYVYNEYLLKSGLDHDSQTEDTIDLRFLNDYIDSLAEELPAQRKKIFILSKRQNYTNKEIAEMMGISESTVATQLSLAVKFMREQLMKHYDKVIALLIAFFVNEM